MSGVSRHLSSVLTLALLLSCAQDDAPVSPSARGQAPALAKGGDPGPPGSGGGTGLDGRWEGSFVIPPGSCSNAGTSTFIAHMIEVSPGRLTGSIRILHPGSSGAGSTSLLGEHSATSITFDAGGSSIYFTGMLQTSDNMSGTIGPINSETSCPTGTWSANRVS